MQKNENESYISLNALTQFKDKDGHYNFTADKKAVELYIENVIKPNRMTFKDEKDRIDYLVKEKYYDPSILNKYNEDFILDLLKFAKKQNFTFKSLMGAMKFYKSYALMTDDKKMYLEDFSERVVMNALFLGGGDKNLAKKLVSDIISNKFQPATPTFLNAGKLRRGEYVSCYLLRVEDTMESIARSISTSLQLSKRGGGVALCLTNLREKGAPIKGIVNQASGVVPVMKLLEDSFSYANQLGQRQGAGAVYLSVHHPDILSFLDTKRENADEKIRIKSLSLGVVIPDITFKLAKENKDMALFSPYDIKREYGKSMTDISITAEYDNLVNNPRIRKTFTSARKLFQTIAELHFESGYPYILFEDTVNYRNPHKKVGRIVMSNLCSEIAQVSTESSYKEDLSFDKIGNDICCNLGSLNIASAMEDASHFGELVENSIKALDHVSRSADLSCAPSIEKGNRENHAIGLGAMNLHGFLSINHIYYASKEAVDFTDIFFYCLSYNAFKASNKLAKEMGTFKDFKLSEYADGTYFEKYLKEEKQPKTEKVKELIKKYGLYIPSVKDWKELSESIKKYGIANSHLLAVAPTGSISYLSSCTPSLQPVVSPIEVRKEGKLGRVYVPAFRISDDNYEYYEKGAYEVGPEAIIDIVSAAQSHVDQSISLTLFMTANATTRDLNRAYIYAFKKGCISIYYVRIRQEVLDGSEHYDEDQVIKSASNKKKDKNFHCTGSSECEACML